MSTMSPELALVDPELRAMAVASLPPIYVNAFLDVRARPTERRPSFSPAAALAYLLLAVVRTAVFEVAVFLAVFAVVLLASLIA
jgi:hypothetical protein